MGRAKIFVFLLLLGGLGSAQAVCPRAGQEPPCKGECGRFIDRDGNGICDEWDREALRLKEAAAVQRPEGEEEKKIIPAPALVAGSGSKTIPASTAFRPEKNIVPAVFPPPVPVKALASPTGDSPYERLKKFSLIPLLIFTGFLVLASAILKARSQKYRAIHRDIWNWLLLLSFLACGLSGLFSYFGFFPGSRSLLFKLHLWSGFFSFIAGLYHFFERYGCVAPFGKCR